MKTSEPGIFVLWAFTAIFDDPLLIANVLLLVVLAGGAVAIWLTYRWYRNLKQEPSTANESLLELASAIDQQEQLEADEVERIRAAIERRKLHDGPDTDQAMS
jgi:membrane protein implicated in regulation of membrane protease activity